MARLAALCAALVLATAAGATPRGVEVERLPTKAKVVALTFDGAWDDAGVPRIMAALARYHATATFFVTGSWVKRYPAVARRLHHCRDLGESEPFDFLTLFDYAKTDASAFDDMLAELRATEEWKFVEREVDIRLVKA